MQYKHIYDLILKHKTFKQEEIKINNLTNNSNKIKFRITFSEKDYFLEFSFTFTTETPPFVKSNFKLMIENENRLCFIVRLDLKEAHTNPSLDDMEKSLLEEFERLKNKDKLFDEIYNLLEKYEEWYFNREEGHVHIFIKGNNHCDKWAIPIKEFINLLKPFIQNKNKIQQLSFQNVSSNNQYYYEILKKHIINFLLLVNFDINEIEQKISTTKLIINQKRKNYGKD